MGRSHGQTLQVTPCVPEAFSHTIVVAVAHLEPARLAVMGAGTLPSVVLTLPRAPGAARVRCPAAAPGDAGLEPAHALADAAAASRCCTACHAGLAAAWMCDQIG
jgi:hypothetical protein